ncbi:hypothetical protein [Streptomyces ficellus]|uniref:Uncharacterized protein n=1 Tax=Streptomyces ficellus TaxID=1977088 RepID=A0A6I6FBM7_9ACTN|nr:hypothetical protein [Streptomyces ficellus]QGV80521.1 hypothetical protein EIZ62_21495 [Streptomyces ficellus]
MPAHQSAPAPSSASESASDVVRWAAFSCALVPVVLLVYGTSFGGAAGTAVGLAAVTAACRVLLRRSERVALERVACGRATTGRATAGRAAPAGVAPRGGRHSRPGAGTHRGSRHTAGCASGD